MLFSHRSITALLLALFVLANGVWMAAENTGVDPVGWQLGHHSHQHDESHNHETHGSQVQCDQHQGCHFHSPVAIQSLALASTDTADASRHQPISFQYCSQSSEPPVPPPDFA